MTTIKLYETLTAIKEKLNETLTNINPDDNRIIVVIPSNLTVADASNPDISEYVASSLLAYRLPNLGIVYGVARKMQDDLYLSDFLEKCKGLENAAVCVL